MKAIMQIIREWLSGHKTGVKERATQALYDAPTGEVLARLLELRKMYVDFWGPEKVYQA